MWMLSAPGLYGMYLLAEPVADKERANFCDYFEMKQAEGEEPCGGKDPLSELKRLFGEDSE